MQLKKTGEIVCFWIVALTDSKVKPGTQPVQDLRVRVRVRMYVEIQPAARVSKLWFWPGGPLNVAAGTDSHGF